MHDGFNIVQHDSNTKIIIRRNDDASGAFDQCVGGLFV